jgi:hypothetical protein
VDGSHIDGGICLRLDVEDHYTIDNPCPIPFLRRSLIKPTRRENAVGAIDTIEDT